MVAACLLPLLQRHRHCCALALGAGGVALCSLVKPHCRAERHSLALCRHSGRAGNSNPTCRRNSEHARPAAVAPGPTRSRVSLIGLRAFVSDQVLSQCTGTEQHYGQRTLATK